MLRLDKIIKRWKEAACLNDHINLYGFWNETAFLTKSGDVGKVLRVPGVDYESLDHAEQEYAVKRLEWSRFVGLAVGDDDHGPIHPDPAQYHDPGRTPREGLFHAGYVLFNGECHQSSIEISST